MTGRLATVLFALATVTAAHADERMRSTVDQFKRLNPCPSTGKNRGSCPGWVVDHIQPLCAGGRDRVANMQWQEKDSSKQKDRVELRLCRDLKL